MQDTEVNTDIPLVGLFPFQVRVRSTCQRDTRSDGGCTIQESTRDRTQFQLGDLVGNFLVTRYTISQAKFEVVEYIEVADELLLAQSPGESQ